MVILVEICNGSINMSMNMSMSMNISISMNIIISMNMSESEYE